MKKKFHFYKYEAKQLNTNLEHMEISEEVQLYFDDLRMKLAFRMSCMFFLVFSVLTYAYSFDFTESAITMAFGAALSLFSIIFIHYTKKYKPVFFLYSTLGVGVTSFALIAFHETVHLVDVLWMLGGVSLGFFSIGKRFGLVLLIISLLAITVFVFYSLNINIEVVRPRTFYQKLILVAEMISGFVLNFYLLYLFTNVNKYSEMKLREVNEQLIEQNIKITLQNDEKTTLVKEVHHRVKNNLQIVVSLLRLQSMEIGSSKMKEHFQESINRIMAMALIHQKLYQNESLSQVKFTEYASDLVNTILRTDAHEREITFSIHSEIEKVGLKSLVPIGLILNELVSNSLKHAFNGKKEWNIILEILPDEDKNWIQIRYSDSGTWKKPTREKQSFGLVLVETLVEQLDGTLKIEKKEGRTTFHFTLMNIEEPDIVN